MLDDNFIICYGTESTTEGFMKALEYITLAFAGSLLIAATVYAAGHAALVAL
jgi:hypothetical protein